MKINKKNKNSDLVNKITNCGQGKSTTSDILGFRY